MTEFREEILLTESILKKRVASGVVVLGIRKIILQLILTFTNIALARILLPEIFGIFGIISFLILTFGLVANFGMGPALIQKRDKFTTKQLRAIFTLLLFASLLFIVLVYYVAPIINIVYKGQLGDSGVLWLRIFSVSVLLDHLATISIHLLQRGLEFKKFTIGEIIVTFVSQLLTIFFVVHGFGLGGLVLGNLIGKVFAIIIFFWFSPWSIGFNFSVSDIKPYLPFGLNFQANNLVGSLNGAVVPIVVGTISGAYAVGLVNWAGGIRSAAMAPFDVIEKLIFPAAARIQDRKVLLKSLTEKMLKLSSLFSFPLMAIIFSLAPALIKIVYTEKWLPGLTTLYLSIIQGILILLGAIFVDVLLALGRAKSVRNISLFWALLQWILTVPLVLTLGFNGVVVAGIIVSATFFIPLLAVRKIGVAISIWPNVLPYLIYSLVSSGFMISVTKFTSINSIWGLILIGSIGAGIYLVCLLLFEKQSLRNDLLKLKELITPKL